jgi:hypothetical protein
MLSCSSLELFISVAEEEKSHVIGRHKLKVSFHDNFKANSVDTILEKNPTDYYMSK